MARFDNDNYGAKVLRNEKNIKFLKATSGGGGISDHTLLTNIGVTTHADIDIHIADFDINVAAVGAVSTNTGKVSFPGFTSLLADYSFTDSSANWNTAFGWGDHSTAGYLSNGFTASGTNYFTDEVVFSNEKLILGGTYGLNSDWGGTGSFYLYGSGSASTTGAYNFGMGLYAADALTSGTRNMAFGHFALSGEDVSTDIVAIGHEALKTVSSLSSSTVAIGSYAASLATQMYQNVAIGYKAMQSSTGATGGVAIGYEAGKVAIRANMVAIGHGAMSVGVGAIDTIAIGHDAYRNMAAAAAGQCVGIGTDVFKTNTTGYNNTAVGHAAGFTNLTGFYNAYFGHSAGKLATGDRNVYMGGQAGSTASSGDYNIAIGYNVQLAAVGNSNEMNIGDAFYATGLYAANPKFSVGVAAGGGALEIASTTGALIIPRMTTTQRNALPTTNGSIIYNTTTAAFNFYENGAWVAKTNV